MTIFNKNVKQFDESSGKIKDIFDRLNNIFAVLRNDISDRDFEFLEKAAELVADMLIENPRNSIEIATAVINTRYNNEKGRSSYQIEHYQKDLYLIYVYLIKQNLVKKLKDAGEEEQKTYSFFDEAIFWINKNSPFLWASFPADTQAYPESGSAVKKYVEENPSLFIFHTNLPSRGPDGLFDTPESIRKEILQKYI